jgi:hypothetical protein
MQINYMVDRKAPEILIQAKQTPQPFMPGLRVKINNIQVLNLFKINGETTMGYQHHFKIPIVITNSMQNRKGQENISHRR